MKWVHPEFLYALFFLAIPVIIHLFDFRRYKKVYFSNLKLLKQVEEKTQKTNRLKHLLALLMRLLAFAFLVFAFSRPYFPSGEEEVSGSGKIVSVYLDNSFSMEAEGANGRLIDQARQLATDIAGQYSPADRFQLVTNDFESVQQRLLTRDEFLEQLSQVKVGGKVRTLKEVLKRQEDLIRSDTSRVGRLIWISDLQKSTTAAEEITPFDQKTQVVVLPVMATLQDNVWIDSVWFETPFRQFKAQEKLFVRLRNKGEQDILNGTLTLSLNGSQKAVASFGVPAGSYVDSVISFTNNTFGIQMGELTIQDKQVIFDDKFYFSYSVAETVPVLGVFPSADTLSSFVRNLFKTDPFYQYRSSVADRLDYSSLSAYSLIVLNGLEQISTGLTGELQKRVKQGSSVAVFPSSKADLSSYTNFLAAVGASSFVQRDTSTIRVSSLDLTLPFFRSMFSPSRDRMDLPEIKLHYRRSTSSSVREERLIVLQNGDPLLSRVKNGKGYFYIFSVPLEDLAGNFHRHAIFVPVLLRIAEWSRYAETYAFVLGEEQSVILPSTYTGKEEKTDLKSFTGEFSMIPEISNVDGDYVAFFHNMIPEAGNYLLKTQEKDLMGLGFNYNRKESDLNVWNTEELKSILEKQGFSVKVGQSGPDSAAPMIESITENEEWWKFCIWMSILFILLEIVILRFWKN